MREGIKLLPQFLNSVYPACEVLQVFVPMLNRCLSTFEEFFRRGIVSHEELILRWINTSAKARGIPRLEIDPCPLRSEA
jgi:hypothetical protein